MSETIIGEWMKSRGSRDSVVLITKVGSDIGQGKKDLSAAHIATAVEDSLRRLQTDRIDVYFSHWHDPDTPYAETLSAYDKLIKAGKIRSIGASNHDAEQLRDALVVANAEGLPRYAVLQPEYNLIDRASFDGPLHDLTMAENLGVISYFALARGFLAGKYRSKDDLGQSPRGGSIDRYFTARGFAILGVLDIIAAKHGVKQADIAIAWVIACQGITAPIASATSLTQLESLINAAKVKLDAEDMTELNKVSRPA